MNAPRQTWLQFFAELGQWVRLDVKVQYPRAEVEALEELLKVEQLERAQAAQRGLELFTELAQATEALHAQKRDTATALAELQSRKDAEATDAARGRQLRREARDKLTELHTALHEENEGSHGGPSEKVVDEHLEQLNTVIQFIGEGL